MIRVVIYLLIVGALAIAAVWLADRPGDVAITWQQWRIETSVMVLVATVVAIAAFTVMLWGLLRGLMRAPRRVAGHFRERRSAKGYRAVSQGLIAIGSGDVRMAKRFADEAARIAPGEPLTLLLTAQASQLSGDRDNAERAFQVMASRQDTRLLGLQGLFVEAQRRNDPKTARLVAEEAARDDRPPQWAARAVFEARCAAADWAGALDALERNVKIGLIDRDAYRRQRAVLLTAQAVRAEDDDRDSARALALEAVKLAPTLVPAAALAGRLLSDAGDTRRSARIIEAAWSGNPHPDLAEAYAHVQRGDSARDRLTRVQSLAQRAPGNIEGALAVARAAIDAQEFAAARAALAPLAIVPSRRVAMLMAELEDKQHNDEGRAREWMARALRARRDPAWTADGFVSDRWMPASPVTGQLDAFQWKDPVSELEAAGDTIDDQGPTPLPPIRPEPPVRELPAQRPDSGGSVETASPSSSAAGSPAAAASETPIPAPPRAALAQSAKVIPLVHVPDDPGPDPDPRTEPAQAPAPDAPSDGWKPWRGLFRR